MEFHPKEIAVKAERFLHVFNGYREVFDSPDGHGFFLSLSRRYGSRPGFEVNRLLPRITVIALIWRQALT
jgi:hypothetical protein